MNIKNKKAQEEIAGFVLIVVLIAIIFLVLLGLFLRGNSNNARQESTEVGQFLNSMMQYTTDCAISEPSYYELSRLMKKCSEGSFECTSGKSVCQTLNETAEKLLNSAWKIGGEHKGYIFKATINQSSSIKTLLELKAGNCSSNSIGDDYVDFPVKSTLRICY
jgi:hypothetical protein